MVTLPVEQSEQAAPHGRSVPLSAATTPMVRPLTEDELCAAYPPITPCACVHARNRALGPLGAQEDVLCKARKVHRPRHQVAPRAAGWPLLLPVTSRSCLLRQRGTGAALILTPSPHPDHAAFAAPTKCGCGGRAGEARSGDAAEAAGCLRYRFRQVHQEQAVPVACNLPRLCRSARPAQGLAQAIG